MIARAPMRISFAGGGTDLPSYYNKQPGKVLSVAIDKYIYVMVSPSAQMQLTSAGYGGQQDDKMFWGQDLALPRAILEYMDAPGPLDILIASSVPPGTGLGSSSAVAVAMLTALGGERGPAWVARAACAVEIGMMGMPIGEQDQYASAYGGLNQICFAPGRVEVQQLRLKPWVLSLLERRLMLFYTGQARPSSSILEQQNKDTHHAQPHVMGALHELGKLAGYMVRALKNSDLNLFARYLAIAWECKKRVSNKISNPLIDEAYQAALDAGAASGKISGAGGGGFLLLYAKEQYQDAITARLGTLGLSRLWFAFAPRGAEVL